MNRRAKWAASTTGSLGLVLVLLVGLTLALVVFHRHEPLGDWLFFHYLRASCFAAVFAVACTVAGHTLLLRVLGRSLPLEEHLCIAFALGVLAFFLLSFAFGIAGLYGPSFFYLCPGLLLLAGWQRGRRSWSRFWRRARQLDVHLRLPQALLIGLGGIGVALVWFPILTPLNASYDARWYHLSIAQHYVALGAIRPFSEGWVPGAMPQLASLLYAWALCAPGRLFDRVELAAHVELVTFLFMLLGVSALVRRLLGRRAPWGFAAVFLFAGVFCYDSGLVLGADHVAALWAAPLMLVALRHREAPSRATAVLLGALAAGALDTKYTAASLLPLAVLAVLLGARNGATPETSASRRAGFGWFCASALLFTAPHWAKNLLFYGDPLFPLLRHWLPAQPWSAAAEVPHTLKFAPFRPAFGWAGVAEMLKTLVTFSFVPHDFYVYHRDLPIFGSLFTLLTPTLLFLGKQPRLRWVFGGVYLGLVTWFWIHESDRYLQVLVPWMAAGTAAVLALLWQQAGAVRAGACALVGLQVVWAGDVPFIPAHRAAAAAIPTVVVDLLGRRYRGENPLECYPEWEAMARALPPDAKVLVHEEQIHFGLSRATLLDYSGHQGALYWGEPGSTTPREIWDVLRSHGVTHLLWAPRLDHASDTAAAGLAFFDFALHHTRSLGNFGPFTLSELPAQPPPATPPGLVAYYACDTPLADGLYDFHALARTPNDPRGRPQPLESLPFEQAAARARWLVHDVRCHERLPGPLLSNFELLAARGKAMLLERKTVP